MAIEYRISAITSRAGEEISLPSPGVTCVVGGNNVGKSQLLRELRQLASESDTSGLLLIASATAVTPTGSEDDTRDWLEERAVRYDSAPGSPARYALRIGDLGMSLADFHYWVNSEDSDDPYLGNISRFFLEHASAGTLGSYAAGYVQPDGSGNNYALMKLRASGDLEAELSQVIREAFGYGVVLDRLDIETRLRVGGVEADVPPLNRPTLEYARALAQLPTLDSQGDGFRSFVGVASQVLTHRFDVMLIDEPEAFLHPGQARVLGRWLAEQASARGMQIVVATHDKDFVIGLLSAGDASAINLVRLSRTGDTTRFTQLQPEEVAEVWARPVLRFSNVLQGLFHAKIVVCEGDADCRFYGAALESKAIADRRRAVADDTLFVPAAGKTGIPAALEAVARLGVESWAFPDFDVLKNKTDIKKIVAAIGGTWSPKIDDLYTQFARVVNAGALWDQVKHAGLGALPPGDGYEAAIDLLHCLSEIRVRIVPLGEMESFDKGTSLHGSAWVSHALEARVHESSAVRDYVLPVLST
jgi:ABC-type cobalamin/Fe3+-siderophores transport system ATPase subunit